MSTSRITSFELGRVIAVFSVIVIHTGPFRGDAYSESVNLVSDILNQLSRFAVPFFFVLSGYFIQPKFDTNAKEAFINQSKSLIFIWLVWSAIYLIVPYRFPLLLEEGYISERIIYWSGTFRDPINAIFTGGRVHLWYLPAFVSAISIIYLLTSSGKQKFIIPVALVFYFWGLGAGSYKSIIAFDSPIFTRNGPFFSLLMTSIGFEIRRRNIRVSSVWALFLITLGLSLVMLEGYFLSENYGIWMARHDFLVGTPILTLGFFFILKNNPNLSNNSFTVELGRRVFGVYLVHFIVLVIVKFFLRSMQTSKLTEDMLFAPLTLFLSFAFVLLLEQSETTKRLVYLK